MGRLQGKRALLMGLNYLGTENELGGCINDARNLRTLLVERFAYRQSEITEMTDEAEDHRNVPTRANIEAAMERLLDGVERDNVAELWISFSGHGSHIADDASGSGAGAGDERDGRDETLVPLDYAESGMILDDQWKTYLHRIPPSCKVFCLFDCCHSGTMGDLPFAYDYVERPPRRRAVYRYRRMTVRGRFRWRRVREWETVPGKLQWRETREKGEDKKNVQNAASSDSDDSRDGAESAENAEDISGETPVNNVVTLSGCRDPQTSADVYSVERKAWGGALTDAFIEVINTCHTTLSCTDLCRQLYDILIQKEMSQRPVLCSSNRITKDRIFFRHEEDCCIAT